MTISKSIANAMGQAMVICITWYLAQIFYIDILIRMIVRSTTAMLTNLHVVLRVVMAIGTWARGVGTIDAIVAIVTITMAIPTITNTTTVFGAS